MQKYPPSNGKFIRVTHDLSHNKTTVAKINLKEKIKKDFIKDFMFLLNDENSI